VTIITCHAAVSMPGATVQAEAIRWLLDETQLGLTPLTAYHLEIFS
jgi:hypothetical protein